LEQLMVGVDVELDAVAAKIDEGTGRGDRALFQLLDPELGPGRDGGRIGGAPTEPLPKPSHESLLRVGGCKTGPRVPFACASVLLCARRMRRTSLPVRPPEPLLIPECRR